MCEMSRVEALLASHQDSDPGMLQRWVPRIISRFLVCSGLLEFEMAQSSTSGQGVRWGEALQIRGPIYLHITTEVVDEYIVPSTSSTIDVLLFSNIKFKNDMRYLPRPMSFCLINVQHRRDEILPHITTNYKAGTPRQVPRHIALPRK